MIHRLFPQVAEFSSDITIESEIEGLTCSMLVNQLQAVLYYVNLIYPGGPKFVSKAHGLRAVCHHLF